MIKNINFGVSVTFADYSLVLLLSTKIKEMLALPITSTVRPTTILLSIDDDDRSTFILLRLLSQSIHDYTYSTGIT